MSLAIRPTLSARYNSVRNAQPKASAKAAAIVSAAISAKASKTETTCEEKWERLLASIQAASDKQSGDTGSCVIRSAAPAPRPVLSKNDMENSDLQLAFCLVQGAADGMKDAVDIGDMIRYREGILQDPNASEYDRKTSEIVLPVEQDIYEKDINEIERKEFDGSWIDYFVCKNDEGFRQGDTKESDDALQAARDFLQGILGNISSDSLGLTDLSDMSADQAKEALNRAADVLYQKADQVKAAYQQRTGQLPDIYSGLVEREPMNEEDLIGGVELQRWLDHQPPLFDGVHNGLIKVQQELKKVDPDTLPNAAKQAFNTLKRMDLDVYA